MRRAPFVLTVGMFTVALWSVQAQAADVDQELRQLRAENTLLKATLEQRNKEITALKNEITSLKQEIAALKTENTKLAAKVPPEPLASDAAPATETSPAKDAKTIDSPLTLKVGDGEMRVRFQFTTFYIPASPPKEARLGYSRFLFVTYQESGSTRYKKPVEGHFRVNGKAEKLSVRSSNEQVISITAYGDDYGLSVNAVGPGSANVIVSLAGQSATIPMKVVVLPINGGGFRTAAKPGEAAHTKDEVIKVLGMPDERVERYLSWPDRTFVDGIFYSASDPRYGVRIEHWKYSKFPNAVISFEGEKVKDARTVQKVEVAE